MDLETEETAKPRRWQQVLYILAPLFLLLVCLGFINFVPGRFTAVLTPSPPYPENETASSTAVSPTPAANSLPIATLSPTPAPTLIPTATLPPDAVIDLHGPPANSSFRRDDTISFYANWPLPLTESQQLAAYIRIEDQPPILLGTLEEPNIGRLYRWQMNVGDIAETAVSLEWWVQLQTGSSTPPILTSPSRSVTLLP
jgi:hypothetical protein